jgi:hypothetical protein
MKSLCLFLLVGIALSFTYTDHNIHASRAARTVMKSLNRAQQPATIHHLQTVATCQAKVQEALDIAATCEVFNIFNDSYTFTYDQTNTIIAAHCDPAPTSCGSMFEAKLNEVVVECQPVILTLDPVTAAAAWLQVGALFVMNRVPCINDGLTPPKWCFSEFKRFAERLSTADITPLVAADLDQGCTACTATVLAVWLAFEPESDAIYSTAYISLLCTKIGTDWCALTFTAAVASITNATTDQVLAAIPTYCVECTFAYLFKWKAILVWIFENVNPSLEILANIAEVNKITAGSAWLCVKNPDTNAFCAVVMNTYNFDAVGLACATAATGCTATCRNALRGVIHDLGCCLDTWLTYAEWECSQWNSNPPADCADPTRVTPQAIRALVEIACGLKIPIGCGRRRVLEASIVVQNLAWAWCQANPVACLDLVRAAIALHFALDRDEVDAAVTSADLSQGPAQTTRRLLQSNNVAISFSGASDAVGSVRAVTGSSTIPNTPPQARGDMTVATEIMVISANVSNAASGLVPSIALILLAIAALLF